MCAPFHTRTMFLFTILLVRFFLLNRHSSPPFSAHTPGHLHVLRPAVLDLSTLPLADIACSSSQAPHAMNYRCACPSYTREQLLACKETAAQLDPKLISRLKELSIGYRLPRYRSSRGGTRKRRQMPVVISQRRSNNILSPASNPDPSPAFPDVLTPSTCASRVNLQNLIAVPLQGPGFPNQLCVCHLNAQSICGNALKTRQKRTAIVDFIADHDVDIMIVSETWLRESGDESKCADLRPPGYKLYNFPRKLGTTAKSGGGIALIVKQCLVPHSHINTTFSFSHTTFELAELMLTLQNGRRIRLLCVYRTPVPGTSYLTPLSTMSFPTSLTLPLRRMVIS